MTILKQFPGENIIAFDIRRMAHDDCRHGERSFRGRGEFDMADHCRQLGDALERSPRPLRCEYPGNGMMWPELAGLGFISGDAS